ncbi:MAG TPA: hypothetical protein VMF66_19915, partial [Candidatus Acidoferrum sp.]|nr:hypothetical protein [Candidatus Acidoferrum sp.]
MEMEFLDANARVEIMAEQRGSGTSSYFIGRDPAKWRTAVPRYRRIRYKELYPGIDLIFYARNGSLEHDWIVSPHADPRHIRLALRGGKDIAIHNSFVSARGVENAFRFGSPIAYQQDGSRRTKIKAHYVALSAHEFGFSVRRYRSELPLVIDPILSYSNFLGGTGTDNITFIAVDGTGNLYASGWTRSPMFASYPTQLPANSSSPPQVAVVTKLDPNGNLVYANFYGGVSGSTSAWGVAVDAIGNAYVCGETYDIADFPLVHSLVTPALGAQRGAFLLKINASGDQVPFYSTFLTSGYDESAAGVAVTSSGNAYVTGFTLPIMNSGNYEAFVISVNATGSAFLYPQVTVHGDTGAIPNTIAIDSSANAYIAGSSYSSSLQVGEVTGSNSKHRTGCPGHGCYATFIAKVTSSGAGSYLTFVGGSTQDTAS